MYFKLLILAVLFFSGCSEVDSEKLKALNSDKEKMSEHNETNITEKSLDTILKVEENITQEQDILTIIEKNTIPPLEKNVTDTNISILPIVKTNLNPEQKYKLALAEIQKDIKLAQTSIDHNIAIATLQNDQRQEIKIKEIQKELEVSKNSAQNRLDLAKLELQKAQDIEKTKQLTFANTHQKELEEAKNKQILAQEEEQNRVLLKQKELEFYKIAAAIIGFLLLMVLLIFYFLRKSAQDKKAKIHQDELNQQMQFKVMEEQGKNLDKMLEIVTSKELSSNVEKEILNSIKESQKKTLIFEEKPKRGLIFRR